MQPIWVRASRRNKILAVIAIICVAVMLIVGLAQSRGSGFSRKMGEQSELDRLNAERRSLFNQLREARLALRQVKDDLVYAQRQGSIAADGCEAVRTSLRDLETQLAVAQSEAALCAPAQKKDSPVRIEAVTVREVARGWCYDLALLNVGDKGIARSGELAIRIIGSRQKLTQTLELPAILVAGDPKMRFSFKNYRAFTGVFVLPADFLPYSFDVSITFDDGKKLHLILDWRKVTQDLP